MTAAGRAPTGIPNLAKWAMGGCRRCIPGWNGIVGTTTSGVATRCGMGVWSPPPEMRWAWKESKSKGVALSKYPCLQDTTVQSSEDLGRCRGLQTGEGEYVVVQPFPHRITPCRCSISTSGDNAKSTRPRSGDCNIEN